MCVFSPSGEYNFMSGLQIGSLHFYSFPFTRVWQRVSYRLLWHSVHLLLCIQVYVYTWCLKEGGGHTVNRYLLGFLRKTLLIYHIYQCFESGELDLLLGDDKPLFGMRRMLILDNGFAWSSPIWETWLQIFMTALPFASLIHGWIVRFTSINTHTLLTFF